MHHQLFLVVARHVSAASATFLQPCLKPEKALGMQGLQHLPVTAARPASASEGQHYSSPLPHSWQVLTTQVSRGGGPVNLPNPQPVRQVIKTHAPAAVDAATAHTDLPQPAGLAQVRHPAAGSVASASRCCRLWAGLCRGWCCCRRLSWPLPCVLLPPLLLLLQLAFALGAAAAAAFAAAAASAGLCLGCCCPWAQHLLALHQHVAVQLGQACAPLASQNSTVQYNSAQDSAV